MISDNQSRHGHSSLTLQLLIYLNWHFLPFYFFLNITLQIYKG
jgi:hypothetical protein